MGFLYYSLRTAENNIYWHIYHLAEKVFVLSLNLKELIGQNKSQIIISILLSFQFAEQWLLTCVAKILDQLFCHICHWLTSMTIQTKMSSKLQMSFECVCVCVR